MPRWRDEWSRALTPASAGGRQIDVDDERRVVVPRKPRVGRAHLDRPHACTPGRSATPRTGVAQHEAAEGEDAEPSYCSSPLHPTSWKAKPGVLRRSTSGSAHSGAIALLGSSVSRWSCLRCGAAAIPDDEAAGHGGRCRHRADGLRHITGAARTRPCYLAARASAERDESRKAQPSSTRSPRRHTTGPLALRTHHERLG